MIAVPIESSCRVYIVAIAWIYVVLMMAISEKSVVAGLLTFGIYGVVPLAIVATITGMRLRGRNSDRVADQDVDHKDGADPKADQ